MKLFGKKIILRDWELHDLPHFKYWHTGHHRYMDFNGPYYPTLTPTEVAETISDYQQKIASKTWESPRKKLVIADKTTNEIMGTVSWYWQSEATNWKSIGIIIYDEKNWSKGIGLDALKLWIAYLFEQDDTLVRLDLRTWSGNHCMMKLGTKLGFKMEARFRKARIVKGEYFDSIGMGILREEFFTIKN